MGISENIKTLREKYDLTQDEIGKIAGVSGKAVSTWENGTKNPKMGSIQKIADHFGLLKSDIIEDKESDFPYYADREADEYAERIHKNPQLRILFDATQDLNTNDIDTLLRIVEGLKATKR